MKITIIDNKVISNRIRRLREANKLTQDELATKLGVVRQSITNYECAKRIPDILILCKLADLFEVSTDYILGRDDYLPERYWNALHVNLVDVHMIYESAKKITDLIDSAKVIK